MNSTIQEMAIRQRLFRTQVATMFRTPAHVTQRRDARLAATAGQLPTAQRYGEAAGARRGNWLNCAEQGLDDCANFVTLQAQFGSVAPGVEREMLAKIAELTNLMEQLRARIPAQELRRAA